MTESYDGRQVVGMDLHRHRSVLVRMTEDGRKLERSRRPGFQSFHLERTVAALSRRRLPRAR